MKTKHDDGLEWLREIRRKMSEDFKHDPKRMGRFYRDLERQYKNRLYRREEQFSKTK
jgi:hypothetical protein